MIDIKKINDFLVKSENDKLVSKYDLEKILNKKSTTDVIIGDTVLWIEPQFSGSFRNAKFDGYTFFIGTIEKDSYSARGQHTFSIMLEDGTKTRKKGRTLFKEVCILIERIGNEKDLQDKHERGAEAKFNALQNWLNNNNESHANYDDKLERFKNLGGKL